MGLSKSYYFRDFTVDLTLAAGGAVKACDIGHFAIIAMDVPGGEQLTWIAIPQNIFVSDVTVPCNVPCPSC